MNVGDYVSYYPSSGGHKQAKIVGFSERNGVKIVYVDILHPCGHIVTVPKTSIMAQGELLGQIEIAA